MRNLTQQFIVEFQTAEEFRIKLASYERAIKSKDWEFVRDTLLVIRGTMMRDMLSKPYTRLPKEEKDITQKVYYQLDQLLQFLSDPRKWISSKNMATPIPQDKVKTPSQRRGR